MIRTGLALIAVAVIGWVAWSWARLTVERAKERAHETPWR